MGASGVELLVGVAQGFQQVVALGLLVSAGVECLNLRWEWCRRLLNGSVSGAIEGASSPDDPNGQGRLGAPLAAGTALLCGAGTYAALGLSIHLYGAVEAIRTGSAPATGDLFFLAGGAALVVAVSVQVTRSVRVGRHRVVG